jgi:hypothetical protein
VGSSDTLRSVIDAGRSSKRLDELSSARVIGKIAQQLHAAQQKAGSGKAVGPVTPGNIKLAPSGEAKLELGEVNTIGYSSPEQTMGGFGDRRSDVFSLGAVLWEALTYQRLFDAMNDAAVRMAVQEREIAPPSEVNANVPAELSAICMRALARNPTDRYQSLKAMAVELEEFLEEAGYADDDSKIASYLATMNEPPKQVKIAMAPLARPASSTQPPPAVEPPAPQPVAAEKSTGGTQPPSNVMKQPAAPSMLGEPPRRKSNSGADLAAALANAGLQPSTSNGATATNVPSKTTTEPGLPIASYAHTSVGVPKLDEWQDSASQPAHAPPPAAAPTVSVAGTTTAESVPLTPLPPVLPSGSTPLRTDKSTIAVSVPPQVKVSTVDAKHAEAKQPALIVEDKPKALIVDEQAAEAKPKAQVADTPPPVGQVEPRDKKQPLVDDGRTTLVDGKPAYIEVPMGEAASDGKLPEAAKASAVETPAIKTDGRAPSHSETTKPSQSDAKKRAPSHAESQGSAKQPHPASAVSLGPGPRDSKDVLAGWGWGTDKHTAIPPDGYGVDDDYELPHHDSRKMLIKIIGGGMALVAVIIIIAFAFGGSNSKKKATTAAHEAETAKPTKPLIDNPPPPPAGSADVASVQPPPQPTEADNAAAAKAAADAEAARIAAEQEAAKQAELAKAETAKQEAERLAAEQKQAEDAKKSEAERLAAEKKQAEDAKKSEAQRLAAEKKQADEAKKAEAARVAAEKKQAADAKKAEAARIAAEKKQEAARIAADKKAEQARLADAKKAEAAKSPKTATTTPKTTAKTRPETTKKTETKVAKADTKAETKADGKLDVETAYRVGLQQFARGDTAGALASLRTSLAGNPNYAPTWRGLGLVFEKMGEKDQARAAYKRYLQLAPSAGDADQIRGRLERLGT